MIGGGFTSRCLFVYADKKAKYVAYPGLEVPRNLREIGQNLIEDLTRISQMSGEYRLTPEAVAWGEAWYKMHYATKNIDLDDERFGGYTARKQTHIHKLAMILAAAESDELLITAEHLALACQMVTDLEPDMQFVFSKIGKTDDSIYVDRLIEYVTKCNGCTWAQAYRYVHTRFPKIQDFEAVVTGAIRSEYLILKQQGATMMLLPGTQIRTASNGVSIVT